MEISGATGPTISMTTGDNFDVMDLIDDSTHGSNLGSTTGNYIINNDLTWVDSTGTFSTTALTSASLSVSINIDGKWIEVTFEDLYKDNLQLQKRNKELEARLFKLEEKFRFMTEI